MRPGDRNAAIVTILVRLLAEARVQQGHSRNHIAGLTGLSQSTISRLESGKLGNPSLETLLRVAAALNLDLASTLARAIAKADFYT